MTFDPKFMKAYREVWKQTPYEDEEDDLTQYKLWQAAQEEKQKKHKDYLCNVTWDIDKVLDAICSDDLDQAYERLHSIRKGIAKQIEEQ